MEETHQYSSVGGTIVEVESTNADEEFTAIVQSPEGRTLKELLPDIVAYRPIREVGEYTGSVHLSLVIPMGAWGSERMENLRYNKIFKKS